jgi:4-diphosphocytidyl-2-C-methyl-D-erythritol kinase
MNNERKTTHEEQFKVVGDSLLIRAPAKINLSLLIAGKRPDGFHEIETIMAKITWYDEILIESGEKTGIELFCNGPQWAPAGKDNLVYKAAQLFFQTYGKAANLRITLTKNIPAGTGLGSASSDAAATLLGLVKYLRLDLDRLKLTDLATELGSDVPFFLNGHLALCKGKGEKIQKLTKNFNFLALIILPDVSISTQKAYANYHHDQALYDKLKYLINNYIEENRIDLVVKMCANMLLPSCFALQKSLAELKAKVESIGIRPLSLSGSGSAMFYVIDIDDEKRAWSFQRELSMHTNCKSIIVTNNRW